MTSELWLNLLDKKRNTWLPQAQWEKVLEPDIIVVLLKSQVIIINSNGFLGTWAKACTSNLCSFLAGKEQW